MDKIYAAFAKQRVPLFCFEKRGERFKKKCKIFHLLARLKYTQLCASPIDAFLVLRRPTTGARNVAATTPCFGM